MGRVRTVQVAGAAIALVGCVLFVMNVQTSAHAWRHTNPTGAQGQTINLPERQPARDASGAAGWSWPEGTPGWRPGAHIQGYPVPAAFAAPRELVRARESAVRAGLEGTGLRIVDEVRASRQRPLAILAAPTAEDPARTCLGALLNANAKVDWLCPGKDEQSLGSSPALIAALSPNWPATPGIFLVGVARGDVRRVVLSAPGFEPEQIYERGRTWGQFDAAWAVRQGRATLRIYGSSGLLEVVRLAVGPGKSRVYR